MNNGIRHTFSEQTLSNARALRESGMSWERIANQLSCSRETIRRNLDGPYRELRSSRFKGPRSFIRAAGDVRVRPEEAERAVASVPPDTRSPVARFMGDPMPGRSALDQMRASIAASIAASGLPSIRATRGYYLRGFLG